MNKFNIRQEEKADYGAVFDLIKAAFDEEELSDGKEQFLVERLRKSAAFIPELSLVAEQADEIIGHILFTKIIIRNGEEAFGSLALAPVSVKPGFQNKGLGSQLIHQGHRIAKDLGYTSVVVLGHENYYPKFGYQKASNYGLNLPFDVPDENCMAIELIEGGLAGVNGVVEYAPEFSD